MRDNRPLPKRIVDAPELAAENEFFFRAFDDLTTCRLFELGPIPYTAIRDYSIEYELDEEMREAMYYVIGVVDAWWREFVRKKIKEKTTKKKGG